MKSVSCIVPVYGLGKGNNMKYFERLLLSLAKASKYIEECFELVIVNDDSLNTSQSEILKRCNCYGLYNVVSYVENTTNLGQSQSRNIGANVSKNEYLHFIDQDDFVSEFFYKELVDDSHENKGLYICKPYFCIEKHEGKVIIPAYTIFLDWMYRSHFTLKKLWPLLVSNLVYSPGQVIIAKDIIMKNNGFPVLRNLGSDDYALFYNLVFGDDITYVYLRHASFYYRIHSNQSSRNCNMQNSVKEFFVITECNTIKEKLIRSIKTSSCFSLLNTILYVLIFKRVKL